MRSGPEWMPLSKLASSTSEELVLNVRQLRDLEAEYQGFEPQMFTDEFCDFVQKKLSQTSGMGDLESVLETETPREAFELTALRFVRWQQRGAK